MAVIIEGLLSTVDEAGKPHWAAMGPRVGARPEAMLLRPFETSTTFRHLARTGQAVFHITDDVELLAQAAMGRWPEETAVSRAVAVEGWQLRDCCQWFSLRVESIDERGPRRDVWTRIVDRGRVREFWGFNRARHAVVEAAILATRIGILPAGDVLAELGRLAPLVEKTAGERERRAWELVSGYVREQLASSQGAGR